MITNTWLQLGHTHVKSLFESNLGVHKYLAQFYATETNNSAPDLHGSAFGDRKEQRFVLESYLTYSVQLPVSARGASLYPLCLRTDFFK